MTPEQQQRTILAVSAGSLVVLATYTLYKYRRYSTGTKDSVPAYIGFKLQTLLSLNLAALILLTTAFALVGTVILSPSAARLRALGQRVDDVGQQVEGLGQRFPQLAAVFRRLQQPPQQQS